MQFIYFCLIFLGGIVLTWPSRGCLSYLSTETIVFVVPVHRISLFFSGWKFLPTNPCEGIPFIFVFKTQSYKYQLVIRMFCFLGNIEINNTILILSDSRSIVTWGLGKSGSPIEEWVRRDSPVGGVYLGGLALSGSFKLFCKSGWMRSSTSWRTSRPRCTWTSARPSSFHLDLVKYFTTISTTVGVNVKQFKQG